MTEIHEESLTASGLEVVVSGYIGDPHLSLARASAL
jgi:hypothetical protein